MLLNTGSLNEKRKENNSIELETLEVLYIERDDTGKIKRIICSDNRILTNKDGLNDIEEFNLDNIKKGDLLRVKRGGIDKEGFSVIYEATSAGVDSIIMGEGEVINRIKRFSIGDLSFDKKYFLEDLTFFEDRVSKISRLIGLLGITKYLEELSQDIILDLKENIIRIGEEIIRLSEKAKDSLSDVKKESNAEEIDFKYLLSKLNVLTQKGELIKKVVSKEFNLSNYIYPLEL